MERYGRPRDRLYPCAQGKYVEYDEYKALVDKIQRLCTDGLLYGHNPTLDIKRLLDKEVE